MKGKSITRGYGGKLFSGLPTKATVTVYDREKNKVEIPCEVEKTSDKTVDIIFEIKDDQMSMKGRKNPFDYDNMIKVQMKTSLSDSILGSWVPAMVSPTFFYAFNVGK